MNTEIVLWGEKAEPMDTMLSTTDVATLSQEGDGHISEVTLRKPNLEKDKTQQFNSC